MPGTRPGMTISFYFNGFVMAGLVPAIHAVAGIPLIACHGAFFRILLARQPSPQQREPIVRHGLPPLWYLQWSWIFLFPAGLE
jgi:hypothetical protein